MISEPCTCCHATGRVEALETSFSKIEQEISRLLVRKTTQVLFYVASSAEGVSIIIAFKLFIHANMITMFRVVGKKLLVLEGSVGVTYFLVNSSGINAPESNPSKPEILAKIHYAG